MMAAVMGNIFSDYFNYCYGITDFLCEDHKTGAGTVIERLGAYQATWGTGLHFKLPIVDRVARRVDMKSRL